MKNPTSILITHNATYANDKRKMGKLLLGIGATLFNDNVYQLTFTNERYNLISQRLQEISQTKLKSHNLSLKVVKIHSNSVGVFSNGLKIAGSFQ